MPVGETMMPVGETMMPVGEKMMTVGENPVRASRLWLAAPFFFSRTRLNRFKTSAYVKNVLSVRATNGIDGLGFEARPTSSEQTQTHHRQDTVRPCTENEDRGRKPFRLMNETTAADRVVGSDSTYHLS
jgi:hypothetical protein